MTRLAIAALGVSVAVGCQMQVPTAVPPPGDGPEEPDDTLIGQYSLSWGPVVVPPSREATQCVWLRLSNETEIKVHRMHNVLTASSHHLIVYKDDMDTVEQRTPVACQPFTGALNPTGRIFPVMITQKHDDELTLPRAVAYTLAPHQMIKIEMHYLNASDASQSAMAKVDFFAADPAAIRDEANILFIGTPDIALGANSAGEVHQFFTPANAGLRLSGAKFFAITGHTHKLGLSVQVGTGASQAGPFTPVYAPPAFVWSEPVTVVHQPEFVVPDGGGFDFTCRYYNGTAGTVKFGESANAEMCFFWAYYYPSVGSHVCVHTLYRGANLDVCCPEAGPQICALLESL